MSDPEPAKSAGFTIFLAIIGDPAASDHMFPVIEPASMTVGKWRESVHATAAVFLEDVAAIELNLWKLHEPIAGEEVDDKVAALAAGQKLQKAATKMIMTKKLSYYFPSTPTDDSVHVILQVPVPVPRLSLKRKHEPSTEIKDGVAAKRVHLFKDSTSNVAPSTFGGQDTYKRLDPTKFALNRPPLSETIPLAILHPIFAGFMHETGTYEPTATDNALVRDLQNAMSKTYDTELLYCSEFRRILRQCYPDVQLEASQVGSTKYVSDGHINVGDYMSSVCEGKLWKGTGDPEVQASGYLITSVRQSFNRVGDYPDMFPCMIVYIFGTFICFAGAVLTDRLHLETLTPAFPMHETHHEGGIAAQAARTLGAFRQAMRKLQEHYAELTEKRGISTSEHYEGLIYPYRRHYSDENSTRVNFHYVRRLFDDKLLFLCQDTSDRNLCVKFTKRYSEEAHQHCANLDVAPKVYQVEPLPGGWIMVVMQYLDEDTYERLLEPKGSQAFLAPEVRRVIGLLHEANFVHGDVRGVNLMVRRKLDTVGKGDVLLVDFDWAGPETTTRYPPHVNNREIYRPSGATDGLLIKREHDIAMVDDMFTRAPLL